jgi:hypothetical protein
VRFDANKLHLSPAAAVRNWTVGDQEWALRTKVRHFRKKFFALNKNSFADNQSLDRLADLVAKG